MVIAFPIYISGLGSFRVGLGLYNIILPLLVLFGFNWKKRYLYLIVFTLLYVVSISLNSDLFKLLNFAFALTFIFQIFGTNQILSQGDREIVFRWVEIIILTNISLYIFDALLLRDHIFYISDKAVLGLPRMKGYFPEPSHLGIFLAVVLCRYKLRSFKFIMFFLALLVCQSFFGYALFTFLRFRRSRALFVAAIAILIANFSAELFFSNSGLVRLFGLGYLINSPHNIPFIGHGIGFGQRFFESIGTNYGLNEFTGFFADFVLDLGLFGVFMIFLVMKIKLKLRMDELLLFVIVYLNVGLAVGVFVVVMGLFNLILNEKLDKESIEKAL